MSQKLLSNISVPDITKRKRAEDKIKHAAQEWRTTFDAISDLVSIQDKDFKIVRVNKAFANAFKMKPQEVIGKVCYELVHGTKEPWRDCPHRQVLEAGKPSRREFFEPHLGIHIEVACSPILNEQGEVTSTVHTIHDITKRRRAEEALRESEEFSSSLLDNAPNPISVINPDTSIKYVNPAVEKLTGFSFAELVGRKPPRPWWPEEKQQQYRREFEEAMGKGTHSLERLFQRRNGEQFWVEITATPVIHNEELKYFLTNWVDITERKRAEEKLKSSEERLKILFEYAPDAYYLNDLKGNLVDGNKAAEEITGYRRNELRGKSFLKLKLLPPRQIPKAAALLAKNAIGQPTGPKEFILNRKDGSQVPVEIRTFPVKIKGQTLVLGIARDITERKQAEERERQLQQELNLAGRLATVGEMAAGIAHEINNPLTGVVGFSSLLMKKKLRDDIRKDVNVIHEGAKQIASITDRMLTFARQRKPEQTTININDIIETTLVMRTYEMESSNIRVTTQLASDLPLTFADAGQLQQVFLNIILNAEQEMIMAHGKGTLSVKSERIDNTIRVSFKDDGPGIPKKNLDKIFNPFFTTGEVGKGAGLGLSISYGIVIQHGGKIYAESRFGKGATFIVELPIVAKTEQLELVELDTGKPEEVSKARILVVDDEPIVQEFLTRILTEEGHEVEVVGNGDDAMGRLGSEDYDVILLDVKLPGTNGIELYRYLQKKIKSLAGRVIFITGDVMSKDTMAFLSRARATYLTKPFDANQLKEDVDRILSQQS